MIADVDRDGRTALADLLRPGAAFKETDVADFHHVMSINRWA